MRHRDSRRDEYFGVFSALAIFDLLATSVTFLLSSSESRLEALVSRLKLSCCLFSLEWHAQSTQ